MDNRYRQHIVIPCYETDASMLLKPASFMDLAQEEANLHAQVLGFGYDDLISSRTAWVLSRMHVRFYRHPKWREEVDLDTWHKGKDGLFYVRDFRMTGKDGELLVAATTSWLVLNVDTRRLVRDAGLPEDSSCHDDALEQSCGKVCMPADAEKEYAGTHTVSYSDVDMNGHTNNAMYMVWAMDSVGYGMSSSSPLKEVRISFNRETRPGDAVELYRVERKAEDGSTLYYVEGAVNGNSAFCSELRF